MVNSFQSTSLAGMSISVVGRRLSTKTLPSTSRYVQVWCSSSKITVATCSSVVRVSLKYTCLPVLLSMSRVNSAFFTSSSAASTSLGVMLCSTSLQASASPLIMPTAEARNAPVYPQHLAGCVLTGDCTSQRKHHRFGTSQSGGGFLVQKFSEDRLAHASFHPFSSILF